MLVPLFSLVPLLAPAPDVSSIASCGTLIQVGSCLAFERSPGGVRLEIESPPSGFQPGDRVWVEGTWAGQSSACDPSIDGVIFSGATFSASCPIDSFCGCFAASPCGNPGFPADLEASSGCATSASPSGARLGLAFFPGDNLSFSADELGLSVWNAVPGEPILFFVGDARVRRTVGDGLLCVGTGSARFHRLAPRAVSGSGTASVANFYSTVLAEAPASSAWLAPGTTLFVQAAFRDSAGPCGSGFNTTGALAITPAP